MWPIGSKTLAIVTVKTASDALPPPSKRVMEQLLCERYSRRVDEGWTGLFHSCSGGVRLELLSVVDTIRYKIEAFNQKCCQTILANSNQQYVKQPPGTFL